MEHEGSLPRSQRHTTCPYPEQDWSSPYPLSYFLKIRFNIIFPTGSYKFFLSLSFSHQNPVCASPLFHMCYMSRLSKILVLVNNLLNVQRPENNLYLKDI